MINKLRERAGSEKGFTLVELLVVILILGILAAIAIPSFLSQRQKAADADSKASARTAATAMETYSTENNGLYTGADAAALTSIEPTLSNASLTATGTGAEYTVTVTSSTGNTFTITRAANGSNSYSCTTAGQGGCPNSGAWSGN